MSDKPRFEIGDAVRLRVDGSPSMIVDGIEPEGCLLCAWTDGAGNVKRHAFPAQSLRAVPSVDGDGLDTTSG